MVTTRELAIAASVIHASLDDLLQQGAALEHRDDFGQRLTRPEERLVQLLERQRIILERGVDHAGGDRELAGRQHTVSSCENDLRPT